MPGSTDLMGSFDVSLVPMGASDEDVEFEGTIDTASLSHSLRRIEVKLREIEYSLPRAVCSQVKECLASSWEQPDAILTDISLHSSPGSPRGKEAERLSSGSTKECPEGKKLSPASPREDARTSNFTDTVRELDTMRTPMTPMTPREAEEEDNLRPWPANIERRKEFNTGCYHRSRTVLAAACPSPSSGCMTRSVTRTTLETGEIQACIQPASRGITRGVTKNTLETGEASFRLSVVASTESESDAVQPGVKRYWKRFVLDPESKKMAAIEAIAMLNVLFDLVVMPFIVAWDVPIGKSLRMCHWISAGVWVMDIVLSFFTGFYHDGDLDVHLDHIARHNLRTWFFPNLAALMGDVLSMALVRSSWSWPLRCLGLVRLHRPMRLFHRALDQSLSESKRMLIKGIQIFIAILWLNHVLSCLWYMIGQSGPADTGNRWTSSMNDRDLEAFLEAGSAYQYITAYQWTISQLTAVGLERVAPQNSLERIFNLFLLIFGLIFVSSLVSSLAATMTQLQMLKQDQVQKLRLLRQFLSQHSVNPKVVMRVQRQVVERMGRKKRLIDKDVPALTLLSSSLRSELRYEILQGSLLKHPLLRLCDCIDHETVLAVCGEAVNFKVLSVGDNLFEFAQQACEGMYHVVRGKLRYTLKSTFVLGRTDLHQDVTEGAWLCEAALWTVWSHTGTAQATVPSELVMLNTEQTLRVLGKHGDIKELVADYARLFHQRVTTSVLPNALPPTDLAVSFTEFGDMALALQAHLQAMIRDLVLDESILNEAAKERLGRLKDEMEQGISCAAVNDKGEVERTTGQTSLMIERGYDRNILVRLGYCDDEGVAIPDFSLPERAQTRGETPPETLERVISSLSQLVQGVQVQEYKRETVLKDTPGFGLPTRHLRTIYSGSSPTRCNITATLLPIHHKVSESGVIGHYSSANSRAAVLGLSHSAWRITEGDLCGQIFSWLPAYEVDRLQDDPVDAGRVIEHWFHFLDGINNNNDSGTPVRKEVSSRSGVTSHSASRSSVMWPARASLNLRCSLRSSRSSGAIGERRLNEAYDEEAPIAWGRSAATILPSGTDRASKAHQTALPGLTHTSIPGSVLPVANPKRSGQRTRTR